MNEDIAAWLEGKPQAIRELVARVPPDHWYVLLSDSLLEGVVNPFAVYRVLSDALDGTLLIIRCCVATGKPMWRVFGIHPEELEPCADIDTLRARLTPDEITAASAVFHRQMEAQRTRRAQRRASGPE
jgi:hypothetical protein